MVISLILGALGFTVSWLAGVKIYFAPLLGLLFAMVPFAWLLHKRTSRLKTFGSQLPESLELVARALRAGHSLAAGLPVVAAEMPVPIADEFNRVYEEQNPGIPIDEPPPCTSAQAQAPGARRRFRAGGSSSARAHRGLRRSP